MQTETVDSTTSYNPTGTYLTLAGLIVSVLSHYGFVVQTNDVVTVISGLVVIVGFVMQTFNHKAVAKAAGLL